MTIRNPTTAATTRAGTITTDMPNPTKVAANQHDHGEESHACWEADGAPKG
jgi:hypothetical protein